MEFCERRWVAPEEEVGAQLRSLGYDPGHVRWVVMTHMHGDHAGGLPNFPKSEILMSVEQMRLALAPTGPLQGYLNAHYPRWLRPRAIPFDGSAWETFEASAKLTRDGAIRIVPTPGHTPGHVSVVADDGGRLIFIAGDAAYSESALLAGTVDGVAYSAAVHRQTTARIRSLCARRKVVTQFAHDADNARRLDNNIATAIT
jgi:glyoxylase-like metal-dependent hydrolase (beta-lactamase superfamily II)